jgi:hypothetical protein
MAWEGENYIAWLVTGRNGENFIRAEGASQAAAWREAVGWPMAAGMIGRIRPGGRPRRSP